MPKAPVAVSRRLAAQGFTIADSAPAIIATPPRSDHLRTDPQRNSRHADLGPPSQIERSTNPQSRLGSPRSAAAADPVALETARHLAAWWKEYKSTHATSVREKLVTHYMRTHVRKLAERLTATLPGLIDIDDLCQVGYLGLVDAIEKFDLDRGVKFETFSARRVSGAMRDYLREIDPMPRLTRWRIKQLAAAVESFSSEHGRKPTREELRRRLPHISDAEFEKMMDEQFPAAMVSFSAAAAESGDLADESDAMCGFEDRGAPTPLTRAERHDLCIWLTRGLCQRDRLIVMLYYYEQMTMKEVGRTLGCSESRVSQRLESVIQRLKSRLHNATGAEQEFWF